MMEGGRCGRRKQRNPKRKNVENGLDEADDTALDANKNEIDNASTHSSSQNSIHSDREESPELNGCYGKNPDENDEVQKAEKLSDDSGRSSSQDDTVKMEVSAPEPSMDSVANSNDDAAEVKPTTLDGVAVEEKTKKEVEEDKIQEYLSRGDTAVIFPEPVSDGDDHQNEDNEQANNSDEEIILKCMHCVETFTRANLLRDHMRESHADKPLKFMCPKCDETFHQKSQLDKHLALHSPTSQICRVCNKTFANVYRLQRHMISHDESTDLRKFKCHECGKAFKFKHHLKEHIRIHSGEKPFECPNCSKRFSHSGSYSSHMTSKKCWVVSAHKNRSRLEGSESFSTNFTPKISFSSSKISYPSRSPLQSVPVSHPHQQHFLPFASRKHPLPTYFPPQMYDAPGFLPCALYPVSTTMATHNLPITIPTLPSMKTELVQESSKKPEPPVSPDSQSAQISPDVNSNTKLIINTSSSSSLSSASSTSTTNSTSDTNVAEPADKETVKVVENTIVNETSVKSEPADMEETSKENGKLAEDEVQPTANGELPCRFCGSNFKSPVDQHQHERYICKQNKDVVQRLTVVDPARQSPSSTMSENSQMDMTTPNGSVGTATDDEDVEEMYKETDSMSEEKKLRIRSLFTEEQLAILKAQYQVNPKPRKFELIRIGNKIGFPKRVVQVWFQNMRARDRKQGRDVRGPSDVKSESHERDTSKSPSYIPNVPKPFPNKLNGLTAIQIREREFPLDLTVRRTPPEAHGGSVSRLSTPDPSLDDQVLNLSMKKDSDNSNKSAENTKNKEKDEKPQPPQQNSFRDSAIFKYMQQEGMFQNKSMSPIPRALSPCINQILQNQMAAVLKMPAVSTMPDSDTNPVSSTKEPVQKSEKNDDLTNGNLVIDEDTASRDSKSINGDVGSQVMGPMTSTPLKDYEGDLQEDTHNLATLAEAAQQAANILSGKPKRLRKKTWRQMESEEGQLEFDDSTSTDDDQPMKKKRKSWKNHRVDRDEGMYACDQCNKMFSKQSSLARHKYEHSGARPFACDMCTKAFKHKHHLTEHKRLHSGEKPFQCKKCGKRFSHSGSFSQHMNHRYNYCSPHKADDDDRDGEMST